MASETATGAARRPAGQRLTPPDIVRMKRAGQKIATLTAYDAPSARLADAAGVDCVLVGDSAAMTVLGHSTTVHITMDEMLMLTRAVTRSVTRALVVADMPFGSFQVSDEAAVEQAVRFVKEAGADAVKLEGAGRTLTRIEAIVAAGIPVVGHIGLTPQSATMLGGYKPQGKTAASARVLVDAALALQHAGCFAVVLEAMPEAVARRITEGLDVPTIGIGAGRACDGQVLVWHDLLGLSSGRVPQFVKQYADVASVIASAVKQYVDEVHDGTFPEPRHTYPMAAAEAEAFAQAFPPGDASADAPAPRKR